MKKNNVVIAIFAVILAVFLSLLYLALGFMEVDHGLDIILAIVWVVIVIIFAMIIQWRENVRRTLIRRFYISSDSVYNPEAGSVDRAEVLSGGGAVEFADFAKKVYMGLEYGFDIADKPSGYAPLYVLETDRFRFHKSEDSKKASMQAVQEWEGSLDRIEMDESGNEKLVTIGNYADEKSLVDLLRGEEVFV